MIIEAIHCSQQDAILSQGEPRDAAVSFVHAVTLAQHGFLVYAYISNRSNAEIAPHSTLIFTAVTQNHGDSRRSLHTTNITRKTDGDREYMIILQH